MKVRLLTIVVCLLLLPLSVYMALQIQQYLSRAAGVPANLSIDVTQRLGPIIPSWAAFAQGGEEPPPMLTATREKMKLLSPRYIRLDHIYDYYHIIKKDGGGIRYDFSQLDTTVDDILAMRALPFFSLSYMPAELTASGSVIDPPVDWLQWEQLVGATIAHYSGKNERNLTSVQYEVWNEPELSQFGKWGIGGVKDYRLLYYHAAAGAALVADAQPFSLGGPAVGSYYPAWITGFLSYVVQNHLRLDFYSWHRYHSSSSMVANDAKKTRVLLRSYPNFANIPLVISEWGIDSENNGKNNADATAAFALAAITQAHRSVTSLFQFEVKDGPPPAGGKWGLLQHEKETPALAPKPLYQTYLALAQLRGDELAVAGQGTYVSGIAARDGDDLRVVLSNYDPAGRNTERVPVQFTGLEPGSYQLEYEYPLDETKGMVTMVATAGTLTKSFVMPPQSLLSIHVSAGDPLATFIPGVGGTPQDKAVALTGGKALVFSSPEFQLRTPGQIRADIKYFTAPRDSTPVTLLDIPYASESGQVRLVLAKQGMGDDTRMSWGIATAQEYAAVSAPIADWQQDVWYPVAVGWDAGGLWLSVADGPRVTRTIPVAARAGKTLTLYPVGIAVDNLEINLAGQQTIRRTFDVSADQ